MGDFKQNSNHALVSFLIDHIGYCAGVTGMGWNSGQLGKLFMGSTKA